ETEPVDLEGLGDLYECDVVESEGQLSCALHDLTAETNQEWAGVQGVFGANDEGTAVYFVANGVLGHQSAHGNCKTDDETTKGEAVLESEGQIQTTYCTLYADRFDGSKWNVQPVATLSGEDRWDWYADITNALGHMTSHVSADGRYV